MAAALVLLRLHRIGAKRRQVKSGADARAEEDGAIAAGANRIMTLVRRGTLPSWGLFLRCWRRFGYVNAAEALIYPAVSTLALLAALLVFQRFLGDLSTAGCQARALPKRGSRCFAVMIGFCSGPPWQLPTAGADLGRAGGRPDRTVVEAFWRGSRSVTPGFRPLPS